VLTTFHVANVPQLQSAIAAVSNSTKTNTILLAPGTYVLANELRIQNASDLTIRGETGKGSFNLTGENIDRIFDVEGGEVTLSGLVISGGGGVAGGGGIAARDANLTLQSCTVTANVASSTGGGIYAQGGTLTLANSTVNSNRTSSPITAAGGGIEALNCAVSIISSTISGNEADAVDQQDHAPVHAAGGGISIQGGSLTVRSTTLANNQVLAVSGGTTAVATGGAIDTSGTVVTLIRTASTGNQLSSFSTATAASLGSAISLNGGSLTDTQSRYAGNIPKRAIYQFNHPGASVLFKSIVFDKRKLAGSYTLGSKGFTRVP
jgi:predicted outer membrane repeat protein